MDPSEKHSDYGQSSEMPNNMYSDMNEEYATPTAESIASEFGIIDGENSSSSFPVYHNGGQLPFGEINHHRSAPAVYDSTTESLLFHHNPPNLRMDQQRKSSHTHRSDESAIVFSTTSVHNDRDESSPNNVPSSIADDASEYPPNLHAYQANASQPPRKVNDHPIYRYILHSYGRLNSILVDSDMNVESTTFSDGPSTSVHRLPTELSESVSNMHLHPASTQQPCKEVNDHPSDFTSWDRSITQAYPSDRCLPNLKIGQQAALPYACSSRESSVVNAGPSTSTYVHEEPLNNSQIHTHSPYFGSTGDHAQGLQMHQYCDAPQNFFSVEQNWRQEKFSHSRSRALQRGENAGEFSLPSSLVRPVQTCSNLDQNNGEKNQVLQSSNSENLKPIGTGGQKPYECKICKEQFRWQYKWIEHMRDAHGVEKPFECDICHGFYLTSSNLKEHKRSVHTNEKRFKCNICSNSFSKRSNLKSHIQRVHDNTKPHHCDICRKFFFSQRYLLMDHKWSFHGIGIM